MEGPATELSLLDCPSIWKLFERPRRPFDENDAPLLLLGEGRVHLSVRNDEAVLAGRGRACYLKRNSHRPSPLLVGCL